MRKALREDPRTEENEGVPVVSVAVPQDPKYAYLVQLHQRRLAALAGASQIAPVLNVELDLVQAALAGAGDGDPRALQALPPWCARASTSAAAALLAQRFSDGELLVRWPGETARRFVLDGVAEATLAPGRWVEALAAAWIARDAVALAVLTDASALETMFGQQPPDLTPAEYRRPWCDLLAGLERGEQPLAAHPVQAAVQRDFETGTAVDPLWQEADVLAVLPLITALAQDDAEVARTALAAARQAHETYERRVRDRERPAPSLLLTGLHCLAFDRGLLDAGSAPLSALIGGARVADIGALNYCFAPRAAASASEIHWFFDLLGAPRAGREHRLEQRGEELIAQYQLPEWAAVPGARAQFRLSDGAQLLDPAQLRAVADRHAAAVAAAPAATEAGLRAQRMHLSEAVGCLDLALARMGGAAAATPTQYAPPSTRLTRSALSAVRDEYRDLLAKVDAGLAPYNQAAGPGRGAR